MKVNLRRASVIQNGIRRAISDLELETSVKISVFAEDGMNALSEAREKLIRDIKTVDRLETILYDIRAKVGEVNATAGVSTALAEDAALKERIGRYTRLLRGDRIPSSKEITSELTTRKEAMAAQGVSPRYYGGGTDAHFGLIHENDREAWNEIIIAAKRRRDELSEKLLQANLGSEIEIDDSDYAALQKAGIV